MLKENEKNGGRKLYPRDYSLLGFTTVFCEGCIYNPMSYEMGETDRAKAAQKCNECMPITERIYRNRQPIEITQDKEGKNIAKPITAK